MSLVPDYGDSSEASDDDSVSDNSDVEKCEAVNTSRLTASSTKLPTPDFHVKTKTESNGSQNYSVFQNPFLDAENEKEAVLEKHVRMVDVNNAMLINGKKICWNYRKGRCRFGHNCRFAHDSDIQKTEEQIEAEKIARQAGGVVVQKGQTSSTSILSEEKISDGGKRKRPGLTQGLTPGKKVMKNYYNQKSQ